MSHQTITIKTYLIVWVALLVLLLATVGVSYLNLGPWGIAIAFVIATVKALLILLYFMHVRYSSRLTLIFASAAFLWLAIMIGLIVSDYMSRGW